VEGRSLFDIPINVQHIVLRNLEAGNLQALKLATCKMEAIVTLQLRSLAKSLLDKVLVI
jgi:hypothetical protein